MVLNKKFRESLNHLFFGKFSGGVRIPGLISTGWTKSFREKLKALEKVESKDLKREYEIIKLELKEPGIYDYSGQKENQLNYQI